MQGRDTVPESDEFVFSQSFHEMAFQNYTINFANHFFPNLSAYNRTIAIQESQPEPESLIDKIRSSHAAEAFARTLLFPTAVSLTHYPTSYWLSHVQQRIPFHFNMYFTADFIKGYMPTWAASALKNFSISNREFIDKKIINPKHPATSSEEESYLTNKLAQAKLVAAVSAVDTLTTQYPMIRSKHRAKPDFQTPVFKSLKDLYRYTKAGAGIRYGRNALGLTAYNVTDGVRTGVEKTLPAEKYGYAGFLLSHVLTGAFSGLSTLWLDNAYGKVVYGMNMQTFKVPSTRKVFKEMLKDGPKAAFRGSVPAVLGMIGTYFTITALEKYLDEFFSPNKQKVPLKKTHSPRFFKPHYEVETTSEPTPEPTVSPSTHSP